MKIHDRGKMIKLSLWRNKKNVHQRYLCSYIFWRYMVLTHFIENSHKVITRGKKKKKEEKEILCRLGRTSNLRSVMRCIDYTGFCCNFSEEVLFPEILREKWWRACPSTLRDLIILMNVPVQSFNAIVIFNGIPQRTPMNKTRITEFAITEK